MTISPDRPDEAGSDVTVAILVYPGCTLLDLVGPHTVLAAIPFAQVSLYWKRIGPIETDSGVTITVDRRLDDAPAAPTILFVPGGSAGTAALLQDDEVLAWLQARAERAAWVTSVCSGSLVLAAAGLLRGFRATSHWTVREALARFGAIPDARRVVVDGNRMTGGGVTAGIDFGLVLAARIAGDDAARAIQLSMEYAPAPPFVSGTPEDAGPELTAHVRSTYHLDGFEPVLAGAAHRAAPVT